MQLLRRHPVGFGLAAACAFLTASFVAMLWQPVTTDEGDFMLAALDWARYRNIIPHPQFYVHAEQAMFALFGPTVTAVRLINLAANLATTILLVPLVRAALREELDPGAVQRAQLIALALWALCPLVVQNTVLIDIDNGVLTTALVLTLLAWLGLRDRSASVRVLATSGAFALALWTKLTTPPLLFAAMLLFYMLRRAWRETALALAAGVLGVGWFVLTHLLYSQFTGFTLYDALGAFWWRAGQEGSILARVPGVAAQATGVVVFWITVPLTLLALAAVWETLVNTVRGRLREVDLLVYYVGAVALFYGALIVPAWGYPRYHTPGYAALCVVLGGYLAVRMRFTRRTTLALGALILAAALVQWFWVGDPLYGLYRSTFATTAVGERLAAAGVPLLKLMAILLLCVAGLWLLLRGAGVRARTVVVSGLFAAVIGSFLATNAVQLTADYSTRYRYTYRYADRQAAIDYVRAQVPPSGYILADRDVLWYAGRPGDLIYNYLALEPLAAELAEQPVAALVWTEKEWLKSALRANPAGQELVQRCFDVETFGIFAVAVRNQECEEFP